MSKDIEKTGFTAPAVTEDDIFEYSFEGEGTTVLAFFPGAFTDVCTREMCTFRDSLEELEDIGAEVIGISVDTPFSLDEFREQNDLNFLLVSDTNKEVIEQYNVRTDFMDMGYNGVARRAVFIVKDSEVVYSEVMQDPENLPDFEKLREKLEEIEA